MKDKSKTKQELIDELDSLKQRVAGYERTESAFMISEKRLKTISEGILSLGNDIGENFRKLTALTGELFGATAAIYNRMEGDLLIAIGHWQTPPGFSIKDGAEGHICYDVIRKNEERTIHIHNLAESPYAKSDPNVCAFGLATYVGHVVRWGSKPVGSLCVVFQQDFIPTAADERLLGIMAASIGAQEKRWRTENALRASEDKYRTLIETTDTGYVIIDNDGLVRDANSEYVRLTGHHDLNEIAGRSVMEWTADYEKEKNAAAVKDCVEKGYIRNLEIDYVDSMGKVTPVEINATCIEIEGKIQTITICHDITARRKAEEALHASENLYRGMFKNHTAVNLLIDPDTGSIVEANEAAVNYYGWPYEQLKQIKIQEINTLSPEEIKKEMENVLTRKRTHFELRHRRADGSIRDVEIFSSIIAVRGKNLLHSIIHDITDRKLAESQKEAALEALRESEERYRRLFNNAQVGLFHSRLSDSKILACNERYARGAGYSTPEECCADYIGMEHYVDSEDRFRLFEALLKHGRVVDFEMQVTKKDGTPAWANLSAVAYPEEGLLECAVIDITERKRAEEALSKSEEKFRKVFYTSPDVVSITRVEDGMYTSINPGFTKIMGYMEKDIIGKSSMECNIWVNIEDRYRLVAGLKKDGEVNNLEATFRTKSGEIRYGLVSATVIDLNGVSHLLGIVRDITDRKRVEEEKRTLEERLQRAEKMEALGALAGGVAHDLNNVLGVIVGYSELLLNEVEKSSPIRPRLTKIMNGSEKAAAIVQDLLTLARRGVSGRKVLNLNKLVLDYKNSPELEKLYSYHSSVQMKLNLEPDLLNIAGSSIHLGKVLSNLVSNAFEAMPKGGELTIKTTNQYLEKPIYGYDEIHEGDYVVLSVIDAGEGIPSADIQRIFEPFYTKKVMGRSGTGLGLAVVWGTVKDHHGYINVESEEGKGSTFTLYFPVTREDVTAESFPISISEYTGKGEIILVVDDVKEQRDLAEEMLKKLNYQVAGVASGEEALEYLKKHKVDLIVLDMIMYPGMDGLDTYKNILTLQPGQKAIIVSGFSESDRVNEAHTLGAGPYVKKPYITEKLGIAVRKELDGNKAEGH